MGISPMKMGLPLNAMDESLSSIIYFNKTWLCFLVFVFVLTVIKTIWTLIFNECMLIIQRDIINWSSWGSFQFSNTLPLLLPQVLSLCCFWPCRYLNYFKVLFFFFPHSKYQQGLLWSSYKGITKVNTDYFIVCSQLSFLIWSFLVKVYLGLSNLKW